MKKLFLLVSVWLCVLVAPVSAIAADLPPDELVRTISDQVLEIVRNDAKLQSGDTSSAVALVEKVVLPHFNFRRMTMLAVGRDWRSATPEQQERLIDGFYGLLVRTYSNALTQYKNQTIYFKPFRGNLADRSVRVQSEIRQSGAQAISVDYVLEKSASGWKVFDIVVAGASLVTNYRNSFADEVRVGGIDGLIKSLEARDNEAKGQS